MGFVKVQSNDSTVLATFLAGQKVPVTRYEKDELITTNEVSISKAEIVIRCERDLIEFKGRSELVGKFKQVLEEMTGIKARTPSIDIDALFRQAADVASVRVDNVEKGAINKVEFGGSGIQQEEDIRVYKEQYKGNLNSIRGSFAYPSNVFHTTGINAGSASLTIYCSGDGILETDLDWIIGQVEAAIV